MTQRSINRQIDKLWNMYTIEYCSADLCNNTYESQTWCIEQRRCMQKSTYCMIVWWVSQSCPTLCNPTDCSLLGISSVHGDSSSKNIGVGCHALLQGIFPAQGLNPGLPICRRIRYSLSHQGSPSLYDSVQFSSVPQSCLTLCDPMSCSMPGLHVHHQLPEFTQAHVHRVGDAIQPSHPLLSPSPPAPNPSQHQSLFQWVNSSHQVSKLLEFQL